MHIQDRITEAIKRITEGRAAMRIPVDITDPDVVLAECSNLLRVQRDRILSLTRWIPVAEQMPEPGRMVLAYYKNALGMDRRIRAMYAAPKTLELSPDAEGGEYDEETDTYWCDPGWYEANEHEECHWKVDEEITHWMPLPAPPVAEPV